MLIRMKETKNGSPDGIRVCTYVAGEVYDLSECTSLGSVFLENKWASEEEVKQSVAPEPEVAEEKNAESSIEVPEDLRKLHSMKVNELKEIAKDKGVVLEGVTKKAGLVSALLNHFKGK